MREAYDAAWDGLQDMVMLGAISKQQYDELRFAIVLKQFALFGMCELSLALKVSRSNMPKPNENSTVSKPALTDEQLTAMTQDSQEFSELAVTDKIRWYQLDNSKLRTEKKTLESSQRGYGLQVAIVDGKLMIELPTFAPKASESGKNLTIATTRGNIETSATVNGKKVWVGVNAYIPAEASKK